MYYTVCCFTGNFYAVVRQISMLFIDNKDHVCCILPCSLSVSHQFVRLFVDSLIRLSIHSRFRFSFHCTLFILSQSVIPQYVCLFVHSFTQDLSSGSISTLSFSVIHSFHFFLARLFLYSFIVSCINFLVFFFFLVFFWVFFVHWLVLCCISSRMHAFVFFFVLFL